MFRNCRRTGPVAVFTATVLTAGFVPIGIIASPALASRSTVLVKGTVGLNGVACTSATNCYAVGDLQQPGTIRGAIVDVTSGRPGTPKLVIGANELNAISCTSATNCYAVGFNAAADGVVVHIAGSSQSAVAVPVVNSFTGVSCVSATLCYAVGTVHNKPGTLVVTISSGRVTRQASAPSLGTPFGIACVSASSCVAVGTGVGKVGRFRGAVLNVSNGRSGKIRTTATSYFLGIACANTTTCYAGTSSGRDGVVVTLTRGVPGAIHNVPNSSQLGAVACASARSCLAVGVFYNSSGAAAGALVKLTSGIPGKANLSGPASFKAVSCNSSGACVAVGTNNDLTQGYLATMTI